MAHQHPNVPDQYSGAVLKGQYCSYTHSLTPSLDVLRMLPNMMSLYSLHLQQSTQNVAFANFRNLAQKGGMNFVLFDVH